jgi:hypothetical protein
MARWSGCRAGNYSGKNKTADRHCMLSIKNMISVTIAK